MTEGSAISKGKKGGLKFNKLKDTPKNSPCFKKSRNDDVKSTGSKKKFFSTPIKLKARDTRNSLPHDFNQYCREHEQFSGYQEGSVTNSKTNHIRSSITSKLKSVIQSIGSNTSCKRRRQTSPQLSKLSDNFEQSGQPKYSESEQ